MMYLSQLLQEGPAETTNYMIAGYAVIFGVIFIYLLSLYVRRRNLEQDLELMEELQERES
jgi:CcmD family protein